MLITTATIQALQTTFSSQFRSAYADTGPWWNNVATMIPSSTQTNTYGWMKRILKMREWLGPRLLQNLSNHEYTLTNKTYEATVTVGREEIEDDMLGIYNPLLAELGRTAAKWPDQLLKDTLQAGTTNTTFDGLSFFNTSHTLDPAGVQSNNFTGTALNATNYDTVRSAMMGYTGEDGEPLAVMPGLLVVPPQLERTARTIIEADVIPGEAPFGTTGGGMTNVLRGSAQVLVLPELANEATTWYLMDASRPIKPFIWQMRRGVQLVNKNTPTDDNVFFDNQFLWGIDGRGATGYSLWFLAARAIA